MHKARSLVQDAYGNAIEETSQQLNITAQVVGPPGVQPTYTILQHQNTAGGLCFQSLCMPRSMPTWCIQVFT